MIRIVLLGFLLGVLLSGVSGCSSKDEEPVKKKDSPFQDRKFKPIQDAPEKDRSN
jgi:hypothetical protein